MTPAVGKRVRLLAPMVNENSSWMPVEQGMPAGLAGTIYAVNFDGPREWHQISVKWDNGRGLALMPYTDRFVVFEPEKEVV
jgi:hypothetical protein